MSAKFVYDSAISVFDPSYPNQNNNNWYFSIELHCEIANDIVARETVVVNNNHRMS